jgi:cysteine synthase A
LGDIPFYLYAKLEGFNPGGSIKDRTALAMIKNALERGNIRPGDIIVESSSGNMGIGLAQACAYFGLRFMCVVDPKTSRQTMDILRAFGTELSLVTEPDQATGDFLIARIRRVQEILSSTERSIWLNQYTNLCNPLAHYQTTMHEIATKLQGKVDYLFCAISTCGTIRGCAEYVRDHHLKTNIVAVDAVGSVIFGGHRGKRLIPGHGAGMEPPLSRNGLKDMIHTCLRVSDLDCIVGCRRLVRREAILAGGSSGGVLMALERVKDTLAPNANCVVILPDHGGRYLGTIYSDAWVAQHFGDVSRLWQSSTDEGRGLEENILEKGAR